VVITSDCSVNTSLDRVATIFGTFVCIGTNNWNMSAFAGIEIAIVNSASIMVIAVDWFSFARSRKFVAADVVASYMRANFRCEDAISVGASVNGTEIVVITDFLAIKASSLVITRSNAAFVSIIAYNRFVLNAVEDCAEVSCASVVVVKLLRSDWSMDTSKRRQATVNSARILVVTIYRGVNTFLFI
jgi:hypothetical protein